jgi:hypothetical protein
MEAVQDLAFAEQMASLKGTHFTTATAASTATTAATNSRDAHRPAPALGGTTEAGRRPRTEPNAANGNSNGNGNGKVQPVIRGHGKFKNGGETSSWWKRALQNFG